MANPLVSVVVKTYLRPVWLRLTLKSIVRQTYQNLEILVFDNAADPVSERVVDELGDPRIHYTAREKNIGLFANAIDGLGRTSGDYILDFQDDDLLHPLFVEALVWSLERQPRATIAFSDYALMDEMGRLLPDRHRWLRRYEGRSRLRTGYYQPFTSLAAQGCIFLSSALIRRDVIDWAKTPVNVGSSYDLWAALRAAEDGASAYYDERPLSMMRLHNKSDSHVHQAELDEGAVFALREALLRGRHSDTRAVTERLSRRYSHLSRQHLMRGNRQQALSCAVDGWRLRRTPDSALTIGASLLPIGVSSRVVRHLRAAYLGLVQANST